MSRAKRPLSEASRGFTPVERIEHEDEIEVFDAARIAEIERQTRAEMDRAARNTQREVARAELETYGERRGRSESPTLGAETDIVAKLDELAEDVRALKSNREILARVERRLNWLLGVGVVAVTLGLIALFQAMR